MEERLSIGGLDLTLNNVSKVLFERVGDIYRAEIEYHGSKKMSIHSGKIDEVEVPKKVACSD